MWSTDGLAIYNEQGRKIASVAYAKTRGCSMRVEEREKHTNTLLMQAAPELAALLARTLPLLVRLGDFTANKYERCELIGDIRDRLDDLRIVYMLDVRKPPYDV
jgi:hypothetical protein